MGLGQVDGVPFAWHKHCKRVFALLAPKSCCYLDERPIPGLERRVGQSRVASDRAFRPLCLCRQWRARTDEPELSP
jgi:hypothetical protein